MSFYEVVRFALRGLSANKLRSALTMLGILIGVAAVILLVAVGNGSAKAISDRIEALGTNTITVMSTGRGGSSSTALTKEMADALVDRLAPRGVLVVVEAEHLCMSMRGVRKPGARTLTSAVRGKMRNTATRAEAMSLLLGHRG